MLDLGTIERYMFDWVWETIQLRFLINFIGSQSLQLEYYLQKTSL